MQNRFKLIKYVIHINFYILTVYILYILYHETSLYRIRFLIGGFPKKYVNPKYTIPKSRTLTTIRFESPWERRRLGAGLATRRERKNNDEKKYQSSTNPCITDRPGGLPLDLLLLLLSITIIAVVVVVTAAPDPGNRTGLGRRLTGPRS